MSRYIDVDALQEKVDMLFREPSNIDCVITHYNHGVADAMAIIKSQPTADVVEVKHGEWIERNVTQDRRDAKIPEWQSAKCSVCGKYHTTPYMYYFTNYDYCPNCGAEMYERREDDKERSN